MISGCLAARCHLAPAAAAGAAQGTTAAHPATAMRQWGILHRADIAAAPPAQAKH